MCGCGRRGGGKGGGGGSWLPCFSLLCGVCTACLGLFALPLGIFGRLCSVIVALPGRLLYNFANPRSRDLKSDSLTARPLELFSENVRVDSRFGNVNCWLQKLSLFAN